MSGTLLHYYVSVIMDAKTVLSKVNKKILNVKITIAHNLVKWY